MKISRFVAPVALALTALFAQGGAQADTVKMLSVEPNIQAGKDFYFNAKKDFEAKNPGTTIQLEFLDDASYKSKLPTLLQSSARPDRSHTPINGVAPRRATLGGRERLRPTA